MPFSALPRLYAEGAKWFDIEISGFPANSDRLESLGIVGNVAWVLKVSKERLLNEDRLGIAVAFPPQTNDTLLEADIFYALASTKKTIPMTSYPGINIFQPMKFHGTKGYATLEEVMDEENGFLTENGTITVRVGIRVTAIIDNDGRRRYNFYDPIPDGIALRMKDNQMLYARKQPFLDSFRAMPVYIAGSQPQTFVLDESATAVERLLQHIHGVALDWPEYAVEGLVDLSKKYLTRSAAFSKKEMKAQLLTSGFIGFVYR